MVERSAPMDDGGVQTVSDPGSPVTAAAGERFAVELAGNLTTGYRWELTAGEGDHVRLLESTYQPRPEGGVGGGGVHRFELEAVSAGSTVLRFRHARPGEEDAPSVRTVEFSVTVT